MTKIFLPALALFLLWSDRLFAGEIEQWNRNNNNNNTDFLQEQCNKSNVYDKERGALENRMNDDSIIVRPADKGSGVIMNTSWDTR